MKGKLITRDGTSPAASQQVHSDVAFLQEALERDDAVVWGAAQGQAYSGGFVRPAGYRQILFRQGVARAGLFGGVGKRPGFANLLIPNPKYTPSEHTRVFNACHVLIEDLLCQGRGVLFDATNLTESFRRPLYWICDRLSIPLVLARFTAPQYVVRRRPRRTGRGATCGQLL